MDNIQLRKATVQDKPTLIDLDFRLDQIEHFKLKRVEKIDKAILAGECFIITEDQSSIGYVIFDYRFFDQGWIELIIIDEKYRGKGIAGKVFNLLCEQCKTDKVFTSTNRSNTRMQRALVKANFTFAGELNGLDDGDPELFYYRLIE
jgi:RimJ/RimL family protein N-acetyltransferase